MSSCFGPKPPVPTGASQGEKDITSVLEEWWKTQMGTTPTMGEGSTNALDKLKAMQAQGAFKGVIPAAVKYAQGQITGPGTSFEEYYQPEAKAINRRYTDEYGNMVNSAAGRGIFGSSAVQDMGANMAEGREASLAGARSKARQDYQTEEQNRFGRGLSALSFASGMKQNRIEGQGNIYNAEMGREQELYNRGQAPAQYGLNLLGSERQGRAMNDEEMQRWYEQRRQSSPWNTIAQVGGAALPYIFP